MDKKLFSELLDSVRDAGRIRRGQKAARAHAYAPETVLGMRKSFKPSQIIRVRHRLKMSQAEFARVMLIPKATLQSWEQGRRLPEGPALVLIRVISKNPEAVVGALHD